MSDVYAGVRVRFVGHSENVVKSSIHRTSEANKRVCFEALAVLEGMTYEQFLIMIERDGAINDYLTVDTYHSSGGTI